MLCSPNPEPHFGQGAPRGRIRHAARPLPKGTAETSGCRQDDTHRSPSLGPPVQPWRGGPCLHWGWSSSPWVGMEGAGWE